MSVSGVRALSRSNYRSAYVYPREGLLDERGYYSTKKSLVAEDQKPEVEIDISRLILLYTENMPR